VPRYVFAADITVEGRPFKAGDEADGSDLLAGCLESLLRLGHARPASPAPPAAPDPKPAKPAKK